MFYILDGTLDAYVGGETLRATAGECLFLPKRQAHAFRIQSPEIYMLVLITPGGFMAASASMAIAAQSLDVPPEDGVTYATVDLDETMRVFEIYGIRFLSPDEIALELPAFPRSTTQKPGG